MNYSDFGVTCAEELEQDEWSLIGKTFETPKGGVLTVVGLLSKDKYSSKTYLVKCSLCAADPELFGDGIFKILRTSVGKKTPCGCAKKVFWKPEQYDTLVKRSAEGVDVMNLGTFSSKRSIVVKRCPIHGETSGDLESFLRSGKCPHCVDKASHNRFSPAQRDSVTKATQGVCDSQSLVLKSLSLGDCYENSSAVVDCAICGKTHIINNRFRQFTKGEVPFLCPCRKKVFISESLKDTKEEMLKKINAKLSMIGAHLIGVNYDPATPCASTRFRYGCSVCGKELEVKYSSIRTVSGKCRRCSSKQSQSTVRLSEELLMARVLKICKGRGFKFIRFTNNSNLAHKRTLLLVPSCCGNAFETSLGSFEASKRELQFCPTCSKKEAGKEKALPISTIKRDLRRDGYDFVDFPNGYINNTSVVTLRCVTHGEYNAKIANVRGKFRSGCPYCAGKISKFAYLNIIMDGDTEVALKFGVSSNMEKRLHQQRLKTIFHIKHLGAWIFNDRDLCLAAEMECKKTLKTGVLSSREMKDGWTETVSVLDLEKVIAIYEKHGGKRIK